MKVTYTQPEEFLEELRTEGPRDGLLRLTRVYRHSPTLPISHVSIVAGFHFKSPHSRLAIEKYKSRRPYGQRF